MAGTRKRRTRRRRGFEQSVPLVVGQRRVTRSASLRSAWVLGGPGGVALLGLVLWVALSPRFYLTDVQVVGASRVPQEAVLEASELVRLHILWVNGRHAEAQILEQLPSVERAAVSCRLPAHCAITVAERQPWLTWEAEGRLFYVDDHGGAFPADQPLEGGWFVTGSLPTDERGVVEQDVLVGLDELTRLGVEPGRISYRTGRGLVLDDPAGWRVILGQGAGMERRLRVYAVVRSHLLARGGHPCFIDVRFPDAPYYSETNEW